MPASLVSKIVNKFSATSCHWTASNEEEEKTIRLIGLVSTLRGLLRHLEEFLSKGAQAMREQHGGVQTYNSINDLMQKIRTSVDKTALITLIFAIYSEQEASILVRGAGYAGQGIKLIDAALGDKQVENTQDGNQGLDQGPDTGK